MIKLNKFFFVYRTSVWWCSDENSWSWVNLLVIAGTCLYLYVFNQEDNVSDLSDHRQRKLPINRIIRKHKQLSRCIFPRGKCKATFCYIFFLIIWCSGFGPVLIWIICVVLAVKNRSISREPLSGTDDITMLHDVK